MADDAGVNAKPGQLGKEIWLLVPGVAGLVGALVSGVDRSASVGDRAGLRMDGSPKGRIA